MLLWDIQGRQHARRRCQCPLIRAAILQGGGKEALTAWLSNISQLCDHNLLNNNRQVIEREINLKPPKGPGA